VDPRSVDLTTLDLHLLDDSPAISADVDQGYSMDFDGMTEALGSGPDMGAFEYHL
jgi:hypothetical protein